MDVGGRKYAGRDSPGNVNGDCSCQNFEELLTFGFSVLGVTI